MGERGPAPRREEERRRRNEPAHPIVKLGPEELANLPFEVDLKPEPPEIPEDWHDLAKEMWEALKVDPARKWMTSADWVSTKIVLESLSRSLNEHFLGFNKDGEVVKGFEPMKGTEQTAILKHLASIGVTEAARLRLQKEITLFPVTPRDQVGNVRDIKTARQEGVQ